MQNFLMDLLALAGANLLLRRRRKFRYLFAAAGACAVAGLLLLLLVRQTALYVLLSHFVLNTGMVFVSFGRCGRKEFLENWAVTYFVVVLLGGTMEWLAENHLLSGAGLLFGMAGIFSVYAILRYLMYRRSFGNQIQQVRIKKRGHSLELKAYRDSGNQLRDPYTGQGICILSREKAGKLLNRKQDRFRLVPYASLGESAGLLWVTDVDELTLLDGNRTACAAHVAVGIADAALFEHREYDVILHASFL